MTIEKEKVKSLKAAMDIIQKAHGKTSVMKLGDAPISDFIGVSTGALSLDLSLGGKGLPRGRVVEIFGPEASGKTTLALQALAEAQKAGGVAVFIDAEHALDPGYAQRLGVDTDEMIISQPDSGEQALDIAETLIKSNAVAIVVVDSVAALVPKAELEGEMGKATMGLQARLMSSALRRLTHSVANSNCILIFINQLREKIGITFGNPETTPGGRALKFYSSVRLDVRRIGYIKDKNEQVIGNRVRIKVVKNKVAPPFRQTEVDLMYGEGICGVGDLVDLGVSHNIITKSGAWYSMGETRLGQGREAAKEFFRANLEVAEKVRSEIIALEMPKTET